MSTAITGGLATLALVGVMALLPAVQRFRLPEAEGDATVSRT